MMKRLLCAIALAFGLGGPSALAQFEVNIQEGVLKPTPIAIPNFESIGVDPEVAQTISDVVRSDLESTGLFTITPEDAYIQTDLNIEVAPDRKSVV